MKATRAKQHRLRAARISQRAEGVSPLERLAESFTQDPDDSKAERIRRMRQSYFADVDALQKWGRVKLPK